MGDRVSVVVMVMLFQVFFSVQVSLASGPLEASGMKEKRDSAMTLGQSIILGLVEGVTEYLPVSSTGHLLLAQRAMGIGASASLPPNKRARAKVAADAYAICIQAGAILAVLGLYVRRVKQMIMGLLGRDSAGLTMLGNIFAGFLPAALFGVAFADTIKTYLFGPWPVIIAWFVGGVAILIVAWWRKARGYEPGTGKPLEALTWKLALWIGIAQCIAMWPGVSRSLVTIVGGVLVGLSLPAAVEFSFLLGVVTLGAATCYDGLKHGQTMLETFDFLSLSTGLAVAFVSAVIAIKWMVVYLNRHGLAAFGYYRVIIAAVTALLISAEML
jgi:undecaprenyl-diphosphatase